MGGMDYLSEDRVELRYTMPLGEIIFDFFDMLKSRTKGTRHSITKKPANSNLTWSRWIFCSKENPLMPSLPLCTETMRNGTETR